MDVDDLKFHKPLREKETKRLSLPHSNSSYDDDDDKNVKETMNEISVNHKNKFVGKLTNQEEYITLISDDVYYKDDSRTQIKILYASIYFDDTSFNNEYKKYGILSEDNIKRLNKIQFNVRPFTLEYLSKLNKSDVEYTCNPHRPIHYLIHKYYQLVDDVDMCDKFEFFMISFYNKLEHIFTNKQKYKNEKIHTIPYTQSFSDCTCVGKNIKKIKKKILEKYHVKMVDVTDV